MRSVARIKRTPIHEVADHVEMAFTHGEMKRRGVIELASDQSWGLLEEILDTLQIAVMTRAQDVPDFGGVRDGSIVERDGVRLPEVPLVESLQCGPLKMADKIIRLARKAHLFGRFRRASFSAIRALTTLRTKVAGNPLSEGKRIAPLLVW